MRLVEMNQDTKYDDLTPKQQEAIDHFIQTDNMTESYRIFAKDKHKSFDSLRRCAYRFFHDCNIERIKQERRLEIMRASQMKPEDVIKSLEDIANGVVADQFSDKTSVKDRIAALKVIADIMGLTEKNNININNNVANVFVDDVKE